MLNVQHVWLPLRKISAFEETVVHHACYVLSRWRMILYVCCIYPLHTHYMYILCESSHTHLSFHHRCVNCKNACSMFFVVFLFRGICLFFCFAILPSIWNKIYIVYLCLQNVVYKISSRLVVRHWPGMHWLCCHPVGLMSGHLNDTLVPKHCCIIKYSETFLWDHLRNKDNLGMN